MASGVLLYVIGASGSGKDSLMHAARETLAGDPNVVFAHRYITRPANAGGENHVALSETEFAARLARNLFAMHWHSHGLHYGLGLEINHWLAKGLTVVVNGSREYLNEASEKYSELKPVLIDVSTEVLRERLQLRGRESATSIETRLIRAETFKTLRHPQLTAPAQQRSIERNRPGVHGAYSRSDNGGSMRISFLGSGAAGGVPLWGCDCPACQRARTDQHFMRRPNCALVEAGGVRLLLDAGVMDIAERFAPDALAAILLTHFHADHVQGLFHWRWGVGELDVYAPHDSEGCADLYKYPGPLKFMHRTKFEAFEIGDLRITPVPLVHSKPTLGYCIEYEGVRLAYLTDSRELPPKNR